jgi:hypothetical protein
MAKGTKSGSTKQKLVVGKPRKMTLSALMSGSVTGRRAKNTRGTPKAAGRLFLIGNESLQREIQQEKEQQR